MPTPGAESLRSSSARSGCVSWANCASSPATRRPDIATAKASAQEARNRGSADARIDFRLSPTAGGTRVDIVTDLVLTGQAAQYGRSAGVVAKVSRFMIGRFAEALRKQVLAASVSDS